MLIFISNPDHPLLSHLTADPVRPEIPHSFRTSDRRLVAMLLDNNNDPLAVTCISFHDFVPTSVSELSLVCDNPSVTVFYTIWSNRSGAGRDLLLRALPEIKQQYPAISTFVTLSPKTELARRFHLKNGATQLRENAETVNYCYSS